MAEIVGSNKIIRNIYFLQRKISMLKKAIAVLAITFFSVPNVLPFVPADDCNMSYHQLKTADVVEQECPPTISECSAALYLPVIAAPLTYFKYHTDFSKAITQNLEILYSANALRVLFIDHLPQPEPPPAYQTPLRI